MIDEELLGNAEGYPACQLDDANIGPDRCLVDDNAILTTRTYKQ